MRRIYTAVLRDILNFVTYKMGHCMDTGGGGYTGGHCSSSPSTQNGHCVGCGHCYWFMEEKKDVKSPVEEFNKAENLQIKVLEENLTEEEQYESLVDETGLLYDLEQKYGKDTTFYQARMTVAQKVKDFIAEHPMFDADIYSYNT